jgi:hypothetical protein
MNRRRERRQYILKEEKAKGRQGIEVENDEDGGGIECTTEL